jgi:ABC-type antimicrobial peptide transport system permease subunit
MDDLVVHAERAPAALASPLRSVVKELDPDVAPFAITTYDQILGKTIATRKFALLLVTGFGAVALLLGLIGIYGVISYSVSQRTREIGIRMALGAQRNTILNGVLWEGLRFTLIGLVLGCAGAVAATKSLQSLLFEVRPTDLTTYIAIAVLLTASALLASLLPARRATKVDPMVALRYE